MENEAIENVLRTIEEEQNVKIYYAVESGSRAWGFPSIESDYDVKFIYAHPTEWYLSVEEKEENIGFPVNEFLDINGIDIKRSLQLLRKTNPAMIEWLNSPIIYKEEGNFAEDLRSLLKISTSLRHLAFFYYRMAQENYEKDLLDDAVNLKKYFYVLRALFACMYIEKYQEAPPVGMAELLESLELPEDISNGVREIMLRKMMGDEALDEPIEEAIKLFIEDQLQYFQLSIEMLPTVDAIDYGYLDEVFQQYLY